MPCLLFLLVLAFPRLVLIVLYLLTGYLERAYHGLLLPILGFIFLPLTTIVYAWIVNSHRPMDSTSLVLIIIAVLIDAGGVGGGAWHRSRRY